MPAFIAVAVIGCIFFTITNAGFGIVLIMLAALLEASLLSGSAIDIGINVFVADLIPMVLFAVGLLRFLFGRREASPITALLPAGFWCCILFVSFTRGVISFGPAAGNDFRFFFYFIATGLYILSFKRDHISWHALECYWIRAAIIMAFLAVFRWAADALGVRIGPDWSAFVAGGKLRVLHSGAALFIATGLLLSVSKAINQGASAGMKLQMGFMGIVVLLLQHRSVWLATILGLFFIIGMAEAKEKKRLLVGLGWLLALMLGVGLIGKVGMLDGVSDDLQRSVEEVGDKRSTIAGRINGWEVLVSGAVDSGPLDMAMGKPMGSGYERYLALHGRTVKENPHSFYVHLLVRSGFIGLALFLTAIIILIRRTAIYDKDPVLQYRRRTLLALLLMNILYITVYPIRFEQALIFGFAMILSMATDSARSTRITLDKKLGISA